MPDSACKACAGRWPPADHLIARFRLTTAYLFEDQYFPGWTVLVLNRHARELFDLGKEDRQDLIEEVTAVALALSDAFQPVKVNYGLLGNQLPHIHWHVVPRLKDDPAPLEAVWGVTHQAVRLAGKELQARVDLIRSKLSEETPAHG